MKALRERYVEEEAEQYEAKRVRHPQWERERQALVAALDRLEPATVLDIPCGTGRFWPLYEERGIRAMGIDLSADMRAEAKAKGWDNVRGGDLFRLNLTGFDLVVCFRFLNWMRRDKAVEALKKLRGAANRGGSVLVTIGLGKGKRGRTPQHDPVIFDRAGLRVTHDKQLVSGPGWVYQVVELR